MNLSYFQLLSPNPIHIPEVGGVISPTLKDISSIGQDRYQYYLNILLIDLKRFFVMIERPDDYEKLTDEEKYSVNIYDLLTQDNQSAILLQNALDFFIKEKVEFSIQNRVFEVKRIVITENQKDMARKYETIGIISRENYQSVVDVILQRNNIKTKDITDPSKVKSKKALSILNKLKKGRENMAKATKADENMELGNIISAVANKSQSLNMLNIWELTVYQLWDCFTRLANNNIYDINAASVSAWGDKDKKFDFNGWFKKLND